MFSKNFEEKYTENLITYLKQSTDSPYNLTYKSSTSKMDRPQIGEASILLHTEIFLKDTEFSENIERLKSRNTDIRTGFIYALENEIPEHTKQELREIFILCFLSKDLSGKKLVIEIYLGEEK
jgi:hypothetical protein